MYKILTAAAAASLLAAGAAQAVNVSQTTFTVNATVLSTCSATAPALNFGNYTPGAGATLTGSTAIAVKCTKSTPYTVSLNAGSTTGGTFAQRLMANGANTLQYNLYTTNTYATVFGDGTAGTATSGTLTGLGANTPNPTTVFGQLLDSPANQGAVPGTYVDTITVSVTY